ncbi:MAG: redoxin domain-containing protein [Solirubrobacteraceae bacterium]
MLGSHTLTLPAGIRFFKLFPKAVGVDAIPTVACLYRGEDPGELPAARSCLSSQATLLSASGGTTASDGFAALGATVVGISAQGVESHQGFVDKNNLTVPLLADVDGAMARACSAHGRMGTKRAVIVIDEDGVVRHRHDHLLGLDYQSVDDLKRALDALPAPTSN